MIDRLNRDVYVQVRPIKMMRMWQLDLAQLTNRDISKPWEVLERHEQLPVFQ